MTQSNPFATISQTIGNTPLVRLQRIPGLENERLKHAELRGETKPGDALLQWLGHVGLQNYFGHAQKPKP